MAPALGDRAQIESACVVGFADVAGRLDHRWPDPGIATRAELTRSRVEVGLVTPQHIGARVAIDGRRSAPDTSLMGLEGESLYMRLQIAEASYALPRLGLVARAGLIDDPWIVSGNQAWGYRSLSAIQAEREAWSPRSDMGASLTWTAPRRVVQLTPTLATGEGLQFRERNAGKDLHLLVEARPLAAIDEDRAEQLVVAIYGREGSTGTESVRSHRVGARISGRLEGVTAGVSVMKSWGVAGDPDFAPLGSEAWVTADVGVLTAAVTGSLTDQQPGSEGYTDGSFQVAAGVRPTGDGPRPAYLLLGWTTDRRGESSAPVAGGDGTRTTSTVFVQLGATLSAAAPIR